MTSTQANTVYRKWHYAKQADFVSKSSTKRRSKDADTNAKVGAKRSRSEPSLHSVRKISITRQQMSPKMTTTLPRVQHVRPVAPIGQVQSSLPILPTQSNFLPLHTPRTPYYDFKRCQTAFSDILLKGLVPDNLNQPTQILPEFDLLPTISTDSPTERSNAFPALIPDSDLAVASTLGNLRLLDSVPKASGLLDTRMYSPVSTSLPESPTQHLALLNPNTGTNYTLERMDTQSSMLSRNSTTPSLSSFGWSFDAFDLELEPSIGQNLLSPVGDFSHFNELALSDLERTFSLA
ncbi:hypothetical protein SARC_00629 [Sphaeroforma arctica JP610]|uniref:Uncharacterized protein n=1 Tax=Sphaeroforma arctica JP610 TaxID=667725 RepID=A0A0L0GG34_9EUKA|nr:hypothetical protein SARC_00629 [Sphaeroforma arctica JP610]KNC87243.1 hypothetical protein SARC_00629 [Sphaeroforma arctica JP610]|eukprot:XP_014161145.1 hypothetical protein SARC_00629 [Sphaeroforma arctica JP610]